MLNIEQKDNQNFGEFIAFSYDEKAGLLQYEWDNFIIFNINYTEVESKFKGEGIGKYLVSAAVDFARKDGKKITATCPFARKILEKDETSHDVFILK